MLDCSFTPTTRIMCENQGPLTITCAANQLIHVIDAYYGRTSAYTNTCSYRGNPNVNCVSQTSVTMVKTHCRNTEQ